ncbi:MAG: aminotransferase class I/II-fold pyridoxal phosphate-dependent enzyme [Candidatus Eisenbacteria sp.]|nr:aminotransferase class I/II-fold pyridoxal phosphate-dependent enzyme [Candidatus Eisenbacteria bacterium]
MPNLIDLRSDTVTQPTAEMRRAMAEADLGDDVFSEDPTVNHLQRRAAQLLGKDAAIFVPSGTMANQLAIRTQTNLGDEIILEQNAHILNHESGAAAAFSGVQTRQLPGRRGVITTEQIARCLRGSNDHYAPVSLVCLENTHNRAGGAVFPLDEMKRIYRLTRDRGLALHIDGARIFNASTCTGIPVSAYAACCDTISFCFSKGLGAPVGSVLLGTADLIARARRVRKMLGGGMRQAGIIAAGALHALEHHVERLADDHRRARGLAEGIASVAGFRVVNDPPETNIVIIGVKAHPTETAARTAASSRNAQEVCQALAQRSVLTLPVSDSEIRLVTHMDVDDDAVDQAVGAFRTLKLEAGNVC